MNASKNIKHYIKSNQANLGAKQKLEEIMKKKTILLTKQETANNNNFNFNIKKQSSQGINCFSPKGRNHQQSFINNFSSNSVSKPLKSSKLKSKSKDKLNQSKQENLLNSYVDTDYYDSIETQPNQPSHQKSRSIILNSIVNNNSTVIKTKSSLGKESSVPKLNFSTNHRPMTALKPLNNGSIEYVSTEMGNASQKSENKSYTKASSQHDENCTEKVKKLLEINNQCIARLKENKKNEDDYEKFSKILFVIIDQLRDAFGEYVVKTSETISQLNEQIDKLSKENQQLLSSNRELKINCLKILQASVAYETEEIKRENEVNSTYLRILKENHLLRMMNGKEVFHNLYQRYSNIEDFEIEISSKEDSKINNHNLPAHNNAEGNILINQNTTPQENHQQFSGVEGEINFDEMTEKLKKLYQLHDNEGSAEVKEKELILFDEIANHEELQLNSFDEKVEFNSLEKLNSIQCSDENFIKNNEAVIVSNYIKKSELLDKKLNVSTTPK